MGDHYLASDAYKHIGTTVLSSDPDSDSGLDASVSSFMSDSSGPPIACNVESYVMFYGVSSNERLYPPCETGWIDNGPCL